MSRVMKAARLFAFICLIVLAGIGVGISGGVPLPTIKNRRESKKEDTELVQKKDNLLETKQDQIIS